MEAMGKEKYVEEYSMKDDISRRDGEWRQWERRNRWRSRA